MQSSENVSEEDGIHNQGRLTRKEHPLAEAVKGLVGVKSVRALSKEVCATVCKLAKSDAASFVLLDGDRVYYADEEAPRAMWKGRYFPIGACISGWAATYQRSAVVEDVFEDARIPIEAYRPTGVRSMVMVPMMLDGEPMGSVGAYWHGVGKASDADLAAIETIGEAACRALEAAEMLDECQRLRTSWDGPGRDEVDAGLLPIVAHDLRSPLAAIATGMSVLETDDLSERSSAALRRMRRSVRRASRMVHQLMTFSELGQHGTLPLELGEVRLDEICGEMAAEAEASHAEGEIFLHLEEVVGLWDRDRLAEAIGNLIVNGLQHSSDRRVTVRAWQHDDRALLSVHNEGEPIPAEVRSHLFEPFRRAGERTRGSVGLGLFIADQIVRAHAGRIDVSSSPSEGTVFTVMLPRSPVSVGPPSG